VVGGDHLPLRGFMNRKIKNDAQIRTSNLQNNDSRDAMPSTRPLKLSAIILARNEEKSICDIIQRTIPHCDEVLVVDGHSTDTTADVARQSGVRLIQDNGKGKGDGIRVGSSAASHEVIVFLDADGSHDPADIPRLVEPILRGDADLVIGSRGKGGSDELHGDFDKLMRLLGSNIILIGINWRWNVGLTDSQNGFRAIRRDVILDLHLNENITTIEQEMTMKALKRGYRVSEIPTHEYARIHGKSSIVLSRVWFRYIYSFLKNLL
jgi:dolichol-phosphate mannosyltransferase